MINSELNLNRLESVKQAILTKKKHTLDRGAGVTTAYLYLMLEEVSHKNSHKKYFFVSVSVRQSETTCREFAELLTRNHIIFGLNRSRRIIWIPELELEFRFMRLDDLPPNGNKIHGQPASKIFLDSADAPVGTIIDYLYGMGHTIL